MAEHLPFPYRLPHTVVPRRYQLQVEPDLPQGHFRGTVVIKVEVRETVREIVLNALDLSLDVVKLKQAGSLEMTGSVSYNASEEQAVLSWEKDIAPGDWDLTIEYRGELGGDMRGFYRTVVTGSDGNPVMIAATQCEQSDARQVLPCWDEPEFKAIFAITLLIEPELRAFSNGREISNTIDSVSGKRRVVFADTMVMSTYLMALIVGPYEVTAPKMVGTIPVRVAARPGFSEMTAYAQMTAVQTLKFFEEYFGVPYPGDKLDHVAVPDFAAGAMENLGCVTYREELLLLDPERSSPIELSHVVETIAHETAHMWFGDLVTMRWWNGIWLNEAFATFMQLLAADALHPDWDTWAIFSHSRSLALLVDGLVSTRPIEFPVGRPVEAWAMFDVLTYQKGGAVLRMLEQYLGPEVFRQSISRYLSKHQYSNTETSDLWDALEETSGKPVRAMMDSWVFQPGYPLVRAELKADGTTLVLTQKQFRYLEDGNGRWQIPVILVVGLENGHRHVVRHVLSDETLTVAIPDNAKWVLVNGGGWGFYRAAYSGILWPRIFEALPIMTAIERYQLADDIWAAVEADESSLSQAVELWRTLKDERDPDVWGAVAPNLFRLEAMANDEERRVLSSLVDEIASPVFSELGWDALPQEDVRQSRVRGLLLRLLGILGQNSDVREEAKRRWRQHLEGGTVIPPELLTPILHVVARWGNTADWDLMYGEFKKAATPQEEHRYLYALSHFTSPGLIRRTLKLYLSDEVKAQDGPIALGQLMSNQHANRITWDAIESRWDELLRRFPARMFEAFLEPAALIADEDLAKQTADWLKGHPIEEVSRMISQTLEFQSIAQGLARRLKGRLVESLGL